MFTINWLNEAPNAVLSKHRFKWNDIFIGTKHLLQNSLMVQVVIF